MATGLSLVAAAGAWQLHATIWMNHYHRVGSQLVQEEESRIAAAHKGATAIITTTVAGTKSVSVSTGTSASTGSGSTGSGSTGAGQTGAGSSSSDVIANGPANSGVHLANTGAVAHVAPLAATATLSSATSNKAAPCAAQPANGPQGLLQIPTLGVVAPVEEGESDQVLSVAVGHDPYSVWPGTNGTSVLTSHDVTYFVNIGHLHTGQAVTYQTPCVSYQFVVASAKVVTAGTTVYNTPGSSIALVTCYPTNALFYTNQRLLVMLNLVKTVTTKPVDITKTPKGVPLANAKEPKVPVPPALAAQGLTLSTNYAPMGTLTILGTVNSTYVQSPAALLAQDAALEAYFGGLKALAQGHINWWSQFAPGVKPPSVLIGHSVSGYPSPVNVYIEAHGYSISGVAIKVTATVGGRSYPMQIGMAISSKNVLTITSWSV